MKLASLFLNMHRLGLWQGLACKNKTRRKTNETKTTKKVSESLALDRQNWFVCLFVFIFPYFFCELHLKYSYESGMLAIL